MRIVVSVALARVDRRGDRCTESPFRTFGSRRRTCIGATTMPGSSRSRRLPPGGRVRVETMVAGGLQRLRLAGVTEDEIPESLKQSSRSVTERGPGVHPMTGPIYVEGAEPGDVLEIRIQAIEFLHPLRRQRLRPGGGVLPDDFPYSALKLIRWKPGADRVSSRPG